jgi:ResB protein required for cytochrome c biosynthesis
VIRSAWRRLVRFLGSAGLAIWLLVIVGVWSMVATLIPQGAATDHEVTVWASAHPLVEPVVRAIGLHQAFTSLLFTVCVLALGVCTALCAWKRTKAAMDKAGTLRRASVADERSLTARHDLEIACDPALSGAEVLSIASGTLARLGIKTKRRDEVLAAVSSPWSVWGSPIFHWALLALILTLAGGNLLRAQGLMGVAVGQTKVDAPKSYGVISAGPLYDWSRVQRSIRVDALEPDFVSGGIDRGPTPTVSLLDGAGNVIVKQRVYPNATLKSGSLTIYPVTFGLSTTLAMVTTTGVETGRGTLFVDFSEEATSGTTPVYHLGMTDKAGNLRYAISATVPLDRRGDLFVQAVPAQPTARVVVSSPDGKPVLIDTIALGEQIALPDAGGSLRLDGVGYYARLQVVDDWSIPLLYAVLLVALAGLTLVVVARQQIVLVTVVEGPENVRLVARVRLWRNSSSSRSEIEAELARALCADEMGSTT